LKVQINELIGLLRENLRLRSRVVLSGCDLESYLRRSWVYSQEYSPSLCEEAEGIAEGAGVELLDIVLLNSFLDLVNFRDLKSVSSVAGCSSFVLLDEATEGGEVLMGQNYEMEAFYKPYSVLLDIYCEESGSHVLAYSYAGVLACAGLNTTGLGLCINFLHASDASEGVLYPFVARRILDQVNLAEAIGVATIGPRAGGMNFLIGHKNGFACSIETSGRLHDILYPKDGILSHTNHYLSQFLRAIDLMIWDKSYSSSPMRRGSTIARLFFLTKRLHKAAPVTIAKLMEVMAGHESHPFSVCFHGSSEASPLLRGETNAALLFDLSNIGLYIASGCPCCHEFVRIEV